MIVKWKMLSFCALFRQIPLATNRRFASFIFHAKWPHNFSTNLLLFRLHALNKAERKAEIWLTHRASVDFLVQWLNHVPALTVTFN